MLWIAAAFALAGLAAGFRLRASGMLALSGAIVLGVALAPAVLEVPWGVVPILLLVSLVTFQLGCLAGAAVGAWRRRRIDSDWRRQGGGP